MSSNNTSVETLSVKGPTDRSFELKISPRRKSLDAELYGLGRTLKHLQPPGGIETGIFDAFRLPPLIATPSTRRSKEYTRSHVFSPAESSPPRPVTPFKETTHYKIFAMSPPPAKPRRYKLTHSTVFDFSSGPTKRVPLVKKQNPITGEACPSRDPDIRRKPPNKRNPITFDGISERRPPSRCKQPPGGLSSIVLEYNE